MAFETGPAVPASDVKTTGTRGISDKGRSATYRKRGLWAIKKKHGGEFPKTAKAEKKAEEPAAKAPKYYPADDTKTPKKRHLTKKPTKLRKSITPGTVLILLAGRFKGKRVVFLKQLDSGLLLITGPYEVNGVPLRRVNAAYVIATSTKVEVSKADLSSLADKNFTAEKQRKAKKSQEDFFGKEEPAKKEISSEFKEAQTSVDSSIVSALEDDVKAYLSSRFSLKSADRPHLMKF